MVDWEGAFGDVDGEAGEEAPPAAPRPKPYAMAEEMLDDGDINSVYGNGDLIIAPLSEPERTRLQELETVVEENLSAVFKFGAALKEIRNRRLYRGTHDRFSDYCLDRYDLSRNYANKKIAAAGVVEILGTIVPKEMLPKNESQVRPLTKLRDPELQVAAWRGAMASARNQRPTARDVESVVREMAGSGGTSEEGEDVQPEQIYSKEFETAVNAMMAAIDEERSRDWDRTSQAAALSWIKTLTQYVKRGAK